MKVRAPKSAKSNTGASGSAATEMSQRHKFLKRNFGFLRGHISMVWERTAISVTIMTSIVHNTWYLSHIINCFVSQLYLISIQLKPQTKGSRSSSRVASESRSSQPSTSTHVISGGNICTATKRGRKRENVSNVQEIHRQRRGQGCCPHTMLRQQQDEAAKVQGQIAVDKDKATAMEHFGTFLGKLGTQIDDRLVPQYYRQALDLSLRMIEHSRSLLPVDRQIQQLQQQPQQYQAYIVYQEQPLRQQQQLTHDTGTNFTALAGPAPGSSQQAATSRDEATSSTWESFCPMEAMSSVSTVPQPSRPQSIPSMSLGFLPRLGYFTDTSHQHARSSRLILRWRLKDSNNKCYGVVIWTAVTVIIAMLCLTFADDVLNKKLIVQIKIQHWSSFINGTQMKYNSW